MVDCFAAGTNGTSSNQINPLAYPNVSRTYCDLKSEDPLAAWENTTVCLVVGGVAKILFYPTTEEFSLMQIVVPLGENTTGAFDNQGIWFQAEFSGSK